jgi:predicted unusual protein kinase regulating ubiquinone biosynthesis (AarF/ABC1/UbiB family)
VPSIPRRTVARTAKLATLPLGLAGRATVGLGKRIGGAPAEAVAEQVQEQTAAQLFKVLGELKGGAMKFGQALSIFEAALPDNLAAPYRATLTQLQDSAPPMPASTVHSVLARELGPRWRKSFSSFSEDPAAAASIGQVHKAVWKDGREVAVKVQYPGAGEALMSDLRQIGRAAKLIGRMTPGIDVGALVDELHARIAEELDYELEASAQRQFAEAFRGDSAIAVPDVVANSSRVLVTEWLESSRSLARLIVEGTNEERSWYGEAYVRFLFSGPARAGLLHSDPHPGNYRLMPDGRLGVVDYGLVARLPNGLPPLMGEILRYAVDDDYTAVLDGMRNAGFFKQSTVIDEEELQRYLGPFVEPARTPTFAFNRSWMQGQFARLNDARRQDFSTMFKINLPPEYLLIHRVWLGGIGVLSQLSAEAPFRSILEEEMPGFAG